MNKLNFLEEITALCSLFGLINCIIILCSESSPIWTVYLLPVEMIIVTLIMVKRKEGVVKAAFFSQPLIIAITYVCYKGFKILGF
jgi:hypothetical protein